VADLQSLFDAQQRASRDAGAPVALRRDRALALPRHVV
jgi:hypothetical protein